MTKFETELWKTDEHLIAKIYKLLLETETEQTGIQDPLRWWGIGNPKGTVRGEELWGGQQWVGMIPGWLLRRGTRGCLLHQLFAAAPLWS